jgi:hypothetical protein
VSDILSNCCTAVPLWLEVRWIELKFSGRDVGSLISVVLELACEVWTALNIETFSAHVAACIRTARAILIPRLCFTVLWLLSAAGKDLFEEAVDTPAEFLNLLTEEINKQDVANLIALENLRKHVIGLHSFELVTGKAKLSVTVQGLDIFDILPDLPNMQSVQDANSLKQVKRGK